MKGCGRGEERVVEMVGDFWLRFLKGKYYQKSPKSMTEHL